MSNEYIRKQDASDAVIKHLQLDYEYAWGAREAINALTSANVAPVVRCGQCKHWQDNDSDYDYGYCYAKDGHGFGHAWGKNDFAVTATGRRRPMDEYIRKADAVNIAESYEVKRDGFHLNDYEYGRNQVADSIASDLEDMPVTDVICPVRCHYCQYYDTDINYCHTHNSYDMEQDDFCSYGYRKEEYEVG